MKKYLKKIDDWFDNFFANFSQVSPCKLGIHKYEVEVCPSTHLKMIEGKGLHRYQKKHYTCKRCGFTYWRETNLRKAQ